MFSSCFIFYLFEDNNLKTKVKYTAFKLFLKLKNSFLLRKISVLQSLKSKNKCRFLPTHVILIVISNPKESKFRNKLNNINTRTKVINNQYPQDKPIMNNINNQKLKQKPKYASVGLLNGSLGSDLGIGAGEKEEEDQGKGEEKGGE
jgi:hypothetical protein